MAWDGGYKDLQAPQASGGSSCKHQRHRWQGRAEAAAMLLLDGVQCSRSKGMLATLTMFCRPAACSPGAHGSSRRTSGEGRARQHKWLLVRLKLAAGGTAVAARPACHPLRL